MVKRMNPKSYTCGIFLGLALIVCGCKTIDPSSVNNFATSVSAVKTQADQALNAASTLTLNESVGFEAQQPSLQEADFVETPTADTIAQWDNALTSMESYANNLSSIISPTAVNNFDVAATNLFNQFNQTAQDLNLASKNAANPNAHDFALLSTAFTEIAGAIISAKEQATAVKVAAATDTTVSNVCHLLADEIGADNVNVPGLRKTLVESVWKPEMAKLEVAFKNPATDKLTISQQFADLIAKRDAEDQILASLRQSLLHLADAHHSLAQGQYGSIQADLNVVASEVQHAQALYNEFSSMTKK